MNLIVKFVLLFSIVVGLALLMAWPVMLLWNYVMPDVFGLTVITFWQALALSMLASFLLKSSSSSPKS